MQKRKRIFFFFPMICIFVTRIRIYGLETEISLHRVWV